MHKLGNIVTSPFLSKLVLFFVVVAVVLISYLPSTSSNSNLINFISGQIAKSSKPESLQLQDPQNLDEDIAPLSASCPVTSLFTTTLRINVQAIGTPKQLVLADFNKDSKLDMIATFPPFLVGVALGNNDGTFGAFTTVNPNLPTIQNMAVADFNGDTNLDVVFTQDTSPGTLVFLPGNGLNGFGTVRTFPTGGNLSQFVASGDFNKDGRPDVALANRSSNNIAIFLNNGTATVFNSATTIAVGTAPSSVTTLDFNNDTNPDLVVTNQNAGTISILQGNGIGSFTSLATLASSPGPRFVALGDFNKNGNIDLVVSNGNAPANISVFLGNGNGTFTASATMPLGNGFNAAQSVLVADYNGDTNPDFTIFAYGEARRFLGNGNGTFSPPLIFGNGGRSALIADQADINGDSKIDLVIPNFDSSTIGTLFGDGLGSFGAIPILDPGNPATGNRDIKVADVNNDGNPDIISTNNGENNFSTLLGNGTGGFAPATLTSTLGNPSGVVIADFNKNGALDVAIAARGGNQLQIFLGNGNGTFGAATNFASGGTQPSFLATGDLNNDTNLDIVMVNAVTNNARVYLGNGAGSFTPQTVFATGGTNPQIPKLGDFDKDGDLDLVIGHIGGNPQLVTLFLGTNTGTFGAPVTLGSFVTPNAGPSEPVIADFNNDTNLDVAVGTNLQLRIFLGNGTGGFAAPMNFPHTAIGVTQTKSGDFDKDGKLDIALVHSLTGGVDASTVQILLGNGDGTFGTSAAFFAGANPSSLSVGDFDKNSVDDIVTNNLPGLGLFINKCPPTLNTTTTLSATPLSAAFGQSVTLSATVATVPPGAPPTGMVMFLDGATPLGSATLSAGTASISTSTLAIGSHSITAQYLGSGAFNSSTSAPVIVTVGQAATVTMVSSNLNPSIFGQSVTFTANVTGTNPTGTVNFLDGTTVIGSGILNAGTTTFATSTLSVGTHSISAQYLGDANFAGSTSAVINQVVNCPVITLSPTTLPNGQAGVAYNQTLTASGGVAPYTFLVTAGALPTGLALSASGLISGTTSIVGTFNFTVRATDANSCTGTQAYSLVIACPVITVSPANLPNSQVNAVYNQTLTASGGTAPYTFSVINGSLPTGLTFTSAGVLSGTPTVTNTFNFTVQARDANNCTGTRIYAVSISCAAINISPTTLPNAIINNIYPSQTLTASGGIAPYTFAVTNGSLPTGLMLTSAGVLSGTPTGLGVFNFTVTTTDTNSCIGTAIYTITVACPNITVNPATLPIGTTGVVYPNQTLFASSGTPPYIFSISTGSLPPGMSLSQTGVLSGRPTDDGTFNFTVSARDANGCIGTRSYSLIINCPTITVSPSSLPNAQVANPYSLGFNASGGTAPYTFAKTAGTLPSGLNFVANQRGLVGTPATSGTFNFTITATDANGCASSKSYALTVMGSAGNIGFSAGSFSVAEGGTVTLTVTRTNGSTGAVSVNYSTLGGTAVAGRDFTSVSGTLTFANNDSGSKTFTVATVANNSFEPNKTFSVQLSGATGGASILLTTASVTINEKDSAQPGRLGFEPSSYSITEKGGAVRVTVTRSSGSNIPVSISYATSPGANATPGVNYIDADGTLSFGVGATSQSFNIPIIDDKQPGGDKIVNIRLSGATNGASLGASTAVLTITEASDPPPPPPAPPAKLQVDASVDFGKVNLGSSATRSIKISNLGGQELKILETSITGEGLTISTPPSSTSLKANENTTMEVTFRSKSAGKSSGSVTVSSNAGAATVSLSAESADMEIPKASFISPSGGQIFDAGTSVQITFQASDNDELSGFTVSVVASTANRSGFTADIGRLDGRSRSLVWNIPIDLETSDARVLMTAQDRTGNITTATSGLFSVRKAVSANPMPVIETQLKFTPPPAGELSPPGNLSAEAKESDFKISNKEPDPALLVEITFQPPQVGQIQPPQNVRVKAKELDSKGVVALSKSPRGSIKNAEDDVKIAGYNVYRVPQTEDGKIPTAEEVVKLENLVTSLPPDATGFMDKPSTGQGDNFFYSVSTFFGNGQMSGGSPPMGTSLPVIKNPMFGKGTIFLDSAGSFIKQGAFLIINDNEAFPLMFDETGTRFTVSKKQPSSVSGLVLKKIVTKTDIVKLTIKNSDGAVSVAVRFNRKGIVDTIDSQASPIASLSSKETASKIEPKADTTAILGFNIYRVPQPIDGRILSPDEIVKPENLVGSISGNTNTFMDKASTSSSPSGNFTYSVSTFFGNGQMSSGSQPASTDLPVIKNLQFEQKTVFLDSAGSFIKQGAVLIVDDVEVYALEFDDTGTRFTTRKKPGSPSNKPIDEILKKGVPARITVRNTDGKISVGVMLTK
jgi:hypothetical protein